MTMNKFDTFAAAIDAARYELQFNAERVHTEKWQGIDISKKPEASMHEIRYFGFETDMPTEELGYYRELIEPNLPWADDHFLERVCGEPLNPGVQWAKWPWGQSAAKFRDGNNQFNHNYMERYWPRYAGMTALGKMSGIMVEGPGLNERRGIRYRYGDLNDLLEQLRIEPLTRQAYMPIFFPEDTGVANPDRKPCTLGYLFMMRNNRLDVTYYIRSCDYVRHFRDDIYMTVRLVIWMLERLREKDERWRDVTPGLFRMDIGSLHLFRNDFIKLFGTA